MARSLSEDEGDELKALPTRSHKCSHKGCFNNAEWYPVFKCWPIGVDKDDYQPIVAEVGLQFCNEHKDVSLTNDKLKAHLLNSARTAAMRMSLVQPDPATCELEMRPLKDATIQPEL